MAEKLIMYVDGFNLYHGLHDKAQCKLLWLDLYKLGQNLRPTSDLIAVRYFTAPVLNDPGAASRQSTYQDALRLAGGGRLEIIQGRYQTKTITCWHCGHQRRGYEEKETDVNIATSLVADAAQGLSKTALVISADSDLVPGVRAARRLNPGLVVVAGFPPKRNSDEMKKVCNSAFHVGMTAIRSSLLPETVTDNASGRTMQRPAKWR